MNQRVGLVTETGNVQLVHNRHVLLLLLSLERHVVARDGGHLRLISPRSNGGPAKNRRTEWGIPDYRAMAACECGCASEWPALAGRLTESTRLGKVRSIIGGLCQTKVFINSASLGVPLDVNTFLEERIKIPFRLLKSLADDIKCRLGRDTIEESFDVDISIVRRVGRRGGSKLGSNVVEVAARRGDRDARSGEEIASTDDAG